MADHDVPIPRDMVIAAEVCEKLKGLNGGEVRRIMAYVADWIDCGYFKPHSKGPSGESDDG